MYTLPALDHLCVFIQWIIICLFPFQHPFQNTSFGRGGAFLFVYHSTAEPNAVPGTQQALNTCAHSALSSASELLGCLNRENTWAHSQGTPGCENLGVLCSEPEDKSLLPHPAPLRFLVTTSSFNGIYWKGRGWPRAWVIFPSQFFRTKRDSRFSEFNLNKH